jgi:putative Mn2+ efflux pump MntP
MNEQLRRIQFVTRYYDWLQGLRFLPVALALLGFATWGLLNPGAIGEKPSRESGMVLAGGLLVALGLYWVMGQYYRRRFGEVRPSEATRRTRRTMLLTFVVAALAISLGSIALGARGPGEPLPVTQGLVLGGLSLVAYWAWTGCFVHHYLGVAAVMAGAGLLHHLGFNPLCPMLHAAEAVSSRRCDVITLHAVSGLSLGVLAFLDHRLLVRTLRPTLPEEEASEPASEPDEAGREAAG